MRLREVGEGNPFQTRLTGRTGIVCGVGEAEIMVEWVGEGRNGRLHPEVEVDTVSEVFCGGVSK